MQKLQNLGLAVLSALLLSVGWPANGFAPLLFIAFVPLLMVEDNVAKAGYKYSGARLFPYTYLTFLIWNLLTTYWVWYSSEAGAIAFILNSLFMALVFQLFHFTKKHIGQIPGYASLVVYVIAWEYIHLQWDLSWPWLTLGNGFSEYYKWVQWYEYTGVFGGGVWMLVSNITLLFVIKRSDLTKVSTAIRGIFLFLWITVPIAVSMFMYHHYTEIENPVNIVVVQPNIDPYGEKFNGMSPADQLEKLLSLAQEKVDSTTDYLIGPETALVQTIWENKIEESPSIIRIRTFLKDYPHLKFVLGLSSRYRFGNRETPSVTARSFIDRKDVFYDDYNSGMQIEDGQPVQLYHKSKLVPGSEKMPFSKYMKPLEKYALQLGGTTGSLGKQEERSVFVANNDSRKIAPVICYESIYGEYCGDYINKGAGLIFIITNDGWWKDTPGYKQHCSYARLRAIEARRSIARSANTGTSCFINQRGDIEQPTKFWVPAVIAGKVNYNDETTFYTCYGDYIARAASILSVLFIFIAFFNRFRRPKVGVK